MREEYGGEYKWTCPVVENVPGTAILSLTSRALEEGLHGGRQLMSQATLMTKDPRNEQVYESVELWIAYRGLIGKRVLGRGGIRERGGLPVFVGAGGVDAGH